MVVYTLVPPEIAAILLAQNAVSCDYDKVLLLRFLQAT